MAEEQTVSTEQPTSTETSALDQVYKDFNVEDAAQSFRAQPQTQQPQNFQQPKPTIPDPVLDADGFKNWQAQNTTQTHQALHTIASEISGFKAEMHKQKEEADIKAAVSKFKEIAGDVDDDMVEVALGAKARKDSRFLAVYNNRGKNPAAWNAAVSAYANDFKAKNQFKTDPQLTENTRAAKQSTQTSQTTKESSQSSNPIDSALSKASNPAEFARTWESILGSGTN
jgi:hypothetical protein